MKRRVWSNFWQKYVEAPKVPQGLSAVHISTGPKLEIATGGDLVQLKGKKRTGYQVKTENAKRGIVTDFSRESRRRLQRLLASINRKEAGENPVFLTLTYPAIYPKDWKEWKAHLNTFNIYLRRKYPKVWGVWRLEFQKRGAPHYHFLLWNGPVIEDIKRVPKVDPRTGKEHMIYFGDRKNKKNQALYQWVSETWYRIVKSGDPKHLAAGTRIEPIASWNGVVWYTSKYLAKLPEGNYVPQAQKCESYNPKWCEGCKEADGQGFAGRFWGQVNKELFPIEKLDFDLADKVFFRIKRVLRRKLENRCKKKIISIPDEGITAFMNNDESVRLLTWALGVDYVESEQYIVQGKIFKGNQ